ncbi:glycoside hydrolase family 3 N-terminal domain-containing protein [Pseudanabaena sp. 'Roaring Creek']|uniref:glycoside hydrolase family 3 N-terminal domain-containing protein n=1 Tax=Pseudanabaena sp. 'Roaring Creek' TaxID=1681830 RepID=UPI0006D7CF51|nr:glycoside hydrolase family 3 N-terminal domain-containing protein [Pseudanabaena sp. 'Roaring Creek']
MSLIDLPDIDSLSLIEQVSQMVVVRTCGMLYDHQIQYPEWELSNAKLQTLIGQYGVGGVILLGGSAPEVALRTCQLQSMAKIPLLIAADIEEGVGQRFSGATWFPPPMALQAVSMKYAEDMGKITAEEALAIGINWMLAPIVDINNNPENPVINVRAFGITVGEVMGATRGFISGAKQHPVLITAKHFPGHGDTSVDSHLQTPVVPHDRQRFDNVEFPPFINAIAAGVDAIMSAHIFVPELDPQNIATLSHRIITGILRNELGFEGIITTDALIMSGVSNLGSPEEIAVKAVKAGVDILLMPVDPIATIHAICAAVENQEISQAQIRASVQRIWKAKQKIAGIPQNLQKLGNPEHLDIAAQIATKSINVYSSISTLASSSAQERLDANYLNLIVVDDPLTCEEFLCKRSPAVRLPNHNGYQRIIADGLMLENLKYDQFSQVFIQIFSRGNPFRGNTNLLQKIQNLVKLMLLDNKLQAVVLYGSPYTLDEILPLLPMQMPWGFAYSQQPEAQMAVLQQLGFE